MTIFLCILAYFAVAILVGSSITAYLNAQDEKNNQTYLSGANLWFGVFEGLLWPAAAPVGILCIGVMGFSKLIILILKSGVFKWL